MDDHKKVHIKDWRFTLMCRLNATDSIDNKKSSKITSDAVTLYACALLSCM